MPKIRDLGTSGIPTLQAAARKDYDVDNPPTCDPPTTPQCRPHSSRPPGPAPGGKKSPGTKPKKYAYGSLNDDAVAQLRSQLNKSLEQHL